METRHDSYDPITPSVFGDSHPLLAHISNGDICGMALQVSNSQWVVLRRPILIMLRQSSLATILPYDLLVIVSEYAIDTLATTTTPSSSSASKVATSTWSPMSSVPDSTEYLIHLIRGSINSFVHLALADGTLAILDWDDLPGRLSSTTSSSIGVRQLPLPFVRHIFDSLVARVRPVLMINQLHNLFSLDISPLSSSPTRTPTLTVPSKVAAKTTTTTTTTTARPTPPGRYVIDNATGEHLYRRLAGGISLVNQLLSQFECRDMSSLQVRLSIHAIVDDPNTFKGPFVFCHRHRHGC
jgi:hypothetical protein